MPKKKSGQKVSDETSTATSSEKKSTSSSKKNMPGEVLLKKCTKKSAEANPAECEKPTSSLHVKLLKIKNKKETGDKKPSEVNPEENRDAKVTQQNESLKVTGESGAQAENEDVKQAWDINGWRDAVNKPKTTGKTKSSPATQDAAKGESQSAVKKSEASTEAPSSYSTVRKICVDEKDKERIRKYLISGPLRFLTTPKKNESPLENKENKAKEETCPSKSPEKASILAESIRENLETLKINDVETEKNPPITKKSSSSKLEKFINSKVKKQETKVNKKEIEHKVEREEKRERKAEIECCDMASDSQSSSISQLELSSSSLDSAQFRLFNGATQNSQKNNEFLPAPNVVQFFKKKGEQWKFVSNKLIDSHCHFDFLFAKIKYSKSLGEYFEDFASIYLRNFEACINVMCDPIKYSSINQLNRLIESSRHAKVFSTIGCHPHFAIKWSDRIDNLIRVALSNSENRIVAIGECGLDLSRKNHVNLEQQKVAFVAQLNIAKQTGKPVVIHSRDAEEQVLEIIKQHLDPCHRIHLHCFTGGWKIARQYLQAFVNLCIGVTPLVSFNGNNNVTDFIKNVPLDRLLLETDSPYFVPATEDFPSNVDYSHPAFVYATAESVAKMRNVSIQQVIDFNRKNVKKVYSV